MTKSKSSSLPVYRVSVHKTFSGHIAEVVRYEGAESYIVAEGKGKQPEMALMLATMRAKAEIRSWR